VSLIRASRATFGTSQPTTPPHTTKSAKPPQDYGGSRSLDSKAPEVSINRRPYDFLAFVASDFLTCGEVPHLVCGGRDFCSFHSQHGHLLDRF